LQVSGDTLPDKTEALLRLTLAGRNIGEKQVSLDRVGGNAFEAHGAELSITGDWTIQAIVRLIGSFDDEGSSQLTIGSTPPTASLPRPAWRFSTGGIAGLLLLVVGIASVVFAWFIGTTRLRRESAGLGAVALVLGALILLQVHSTPADAVATTPKPVLADTASVTRGEAVFQANCAACHGATGKGDGPAGVGLNPRPADLTGGHSLAHPDGQYFLWIKNGKPNTAMPGLTGSLSDQQIWDVINYVRVTLQGRAPAEASPTPEPSPAGQ
jgi:copper transport protein